MVDRRAGGVAAKCILWKPWSELSSYTKSEQTAHLCRDMEQGFFCFRQAEYW